MTSGDELNALLTASLRLAEKHLAGAASFEPFVLVTSPDGRTLAAEIDRSQLQRHPESEEIADAAIAQLRGLAPSVRATALTLNARLAKERSDAIEVRLEHRDGVALLVLVPYRKPKFGGRIEYGDMQTFRGTRDVWQQSLS